MQRPGKGQPYFLINHDCPLPVGKTDKNRFIRYSRIEPASNEKPKDAIMGNK
jgi:hypothetical protein